MIGNLTAARSRIQDADFASETANQLPQGVLGGKAVAKLVLMSDSIDIFGAMSGRVIFEGDIISPLENEWEAAR